ncbi:MAG: hypothetical protein ACUVSX_04490 [Aggregatilineales bacterium]
MKPTTDLGNDLVRAGLVQFGWYTPNGQPYRLHLSMLPSYPDILRQAAAQLAQAVRGADRLLAAADSIPLGVAVSLHTRIPLVYIQQGSSVAHTFVGAYDIGHPTVLIVNDLSDWDTIVDLARSARQVGLEIKSVVALIICRAPNSAHELAASGIVSLENLTTTMADNGKLPSHHAQAVLAWLKQGS